MHVETKPLCQRMYQQSLKIQVYNAWTKNIKKKKVPNDIQSRFVEREFKYNLKRTEIFKKKSQKNKKNKNPD